MPLKPECVPVTPDRWADLVDLFGAQGACGGCWCMAWRSAPKLLRANKGRGNRTALRALVAGGPAPGLLALTAGKAIGWCAVAPRESYPFLARSRVLRPVDNTPVWSVSCLFVRKEWRRKGVATALLAAAARYAYRSGAAAVEGYPVVPYVSEMPAAFAWTGTLKNFIAAGYVEVARRSPSRPIMRHAEGREG